jgi:hypothetical protein
VDNKRWGQRAREVQFHELAAVRTTAEQWRTGLGGLTALLSAAALITAPDLGKALTGFARAAVGSLALAGLLVLVFATWRVMVAAFGVPGQAIALTGERLKEWEQDQATTATRLLGQARVCFLAGLLLLVVASAVAFAAQPADGQAVIVTTRTDAFCGHLGPAAADQLRLTTADGVVHTLPFSTIATVSAASSC